MDAQNINISLFVILMFCLTTLHTQSRMPIRTLAKTVEHKQLTAHEMQALEQWIEQQQRYITSSKELPLFQELALLCQKKLYLRVLTVIAQHGKNNLKNFPLNEARLLYLTQQLNRYPWYIQEIGKLPDKKFQHETDKILFLIEITRQFHADFEKKEYKDSALLPLIRNLITACKQHSSYSDPIIHKKLIRSIARLELIADIIIRANASLHGKRR